MHRNKQCVYMNTTKQITGGNPVTEEICQCLHEQWTGCYEIHLHAEGPVIRFFSYMYNLILEPYLF